MKTEIESMVARLPAVGLSNARHLDKEIISRYTVVAVNNGEIVTPVEALCYMGRSYGASVVHAAIWITSCPYRTCTSGRGRADGGSYNKESAAVDAAIQSAGIELYGSVHLGHNKIPDFSRRCSIDGAGDGAIRTALLAIGRAVYPNATAIELIR